MNVNTPGNDHARGSFPGPKRLWLDDRRSRNIAIPIGDPEKDVLDVIPIQEHVSHGKLTDTTAQHVLYDTHNGFAHSRRYNLQKFSIVLDRDVKLND